MALTQLPLPPAAGAEVEASARTDLLAAGGLTPKLYGLVTTKAPSSCFGNLLGSIELYRCAPPLCGGRNVSRS